MAEQITPSHSFEIGLNNGGEAGTRAAVSPLMEKVVTQLASGQHIDLSKKGVTLNLESSDRSKSRWLISNIDGERIGVTRCQSNEEKQLRPDLDMIFEITKLGWEPREIIYAKSTWDEFAQVAQAQALMVFDEQGDLRYDVFTEFWAQKIEKARWLEQGHSVKDVLLLADGTTKTLAELQKQEDAAEALNWNPGPLRIFDSKGIKWQEDLSDDARWLMERLVWDGEGDIEYLQYLATEQEKNLQKAIAELEGYEFLDRSKSGWIDLQYTLIPSKGSGENSEI